MRILPLLAALSLLTACNKGPVVKAPTFTKEGDQVTYAEFQTKLEAAYKASELYDDGMGELPALGDRVEKGSYSSSHIETVKRNKKEVRKEERAGSTSGEQLFDYDNLASKVASNSKETTSTKTEEVSSSSTSTGKSETYYQFGKIDNEDYLLSVNPKTKSYRQYTSVSSDSTPAKTFDRFVRNSISNIQSLFTYYCPSESDAKDYVFANRENLFTLSTSTEKSDSLLQGADKYADYKTSTKIKVQLDISDGKQSLKLSYEVKTETTYTQAYPSYSQNFLKDDIYIEEIKEYYDISFASKKADVKTVEITEEYAYLN